MKDGAKTLTYLLRDVPAPVWLRAARQAKRDGLTMRGLILVLLQRYAHGQTALVSPEERERFVR
jgi:hypothetical protein